MNLIKQTGGYYQAKNWLDKNEIHVKHGYLEKYRAELLQYRRENNIFEVGDKIVYPWLDNKIHEYNDMVIIKSPFRHATPQEIEIGRRLD